MAIRIGTPLGAGACVTAAGEAVCSLTWACAGDPHTKPQANTTMANITDLLRAKPLEAVRVVAG